MPGGGPHPLGQGIRKEGPGWLCSRLSLGGAHGRNWFISGADTSCSCCGRKRSLGPGGARRGEAGRGGSKLTSNLSSSFHSLPRATMSPITGRRVGLKVPSPEGDPGQITHPLWASVSLAVKSEG